MSKKKNVLFVSLGQSAPVVTESIDVLLRDYGIKIDEVLIFTTRNNVKTIVVEDEIEQYYNWNIQTLIVNVKSEDIVNSEDNIRFAQLVSQWLTSYSQHSNVYVSLAGGRKTMSAIMALMAQLFGAKMLFHVLVDNHTEKQGRYGDDEKVDMHPQNVQMVILPFIGLFPWINDIIQILEGEFKNTNKDLVDLMKANNIIDSTGNLTEVGKIFKDIISVVEHAPTKVSNKTPQEKIAKLPTHDYEDREALEKAMSNLAGVPYVDRVTTAPWNSATSKSYVIGNDNSIIFYLKDTKKGLAIKAITTAQNKKQAEFVAKLCSNMF